MKEKRDKKGRKWRLVEPAYPVGTYTTTSYTRQAQAHTT